MRWKDPSWSLGNISGMIDNGAPLKDTVMVPVGGYVVLRLKADNPGRFQEEGWVSWWSTVVGNQRP